MRKMLRFFLVIVVLSLFCMVPPVLCIAQGGEDEVIQFNDAVLEDIIRKHLDRPEGPVTVKDARGFDWLDAGMPGDLPDEEKIRDVSVLRFFSNLSGLRLDNNLISDITPLAELKQLKELSVLDNPVKDIQPVSGLTGLHFLGIRSDFQDVSFIGSMTELEGLRIDGLEQLPEALLQLKGLKLFCSLGGKLSDISLLAQIPALEVVDLSWNRITDLRPLSGLPLRELYLEGNPIVDYSPIKELYPNLQGKNFDYIEFQQPDNPGLIIRFPDPVMEMKVRQALDIPQGDITAGDAARVSILMLANEWEPEIPAETQITDLTGIEHFINLQELDCNFNAVEDISGLAGLTQLKRLSLGGNRLSDISVLAGLTELEGLEIFGNSIQDICPVSGLTSLRLLHIAGLSVSDIEPLRNLTCIEILFADNCGIQDIGPLAGMVNMQLLELTGNYITDLSPLAGMSALKTLNLADNPIQDYTPIQTLYEKLEEKNFEYGQAFDVRVPLKPENPDESVSIPDAGLEAILRQVTGVYDRPINQGDLSKIRRISWDTKGMWQEVKDISPLKYCLNIEELVIISSKVSDLTPLSGLTALRSLTLAESAVSALTPLEGLSQLLELNLWGNQITDITPVKALTNLERLDLSNNQIADISALTELKQLKALLVMGNPVGDFSPLAELKQLQELWVLDNLVKSVDVQPLGALTGLQKLGVDCNFQDVSFVGNMPDLEELRIDNCRVLPETLVKLKKLKVFCSLFGELADISLLAQIPTLEVVDLTWNRISDLMPLSNLPLTELYLGDNPIVDYSPIRELYPNLKGRNFEYIELKQPENPDLVITFPDPVMEKKVRQALGIPQGDITAGAVAKVINLNLTNEWQPQIPAETQITDLSGIEYFINLQDLSAELNAIPDISCLSGLTGLKWVGLGGNRITDIKVLAGLKNLEGLTLFGNGIRDISPVSGLTSLSFLHLGNVSVRDLEPLQNLTRLDSLYLGNCGIWDISPLSGMVNMCRLEIKNNYITDLSPLAGMTGLKTLQLANNPIQDYTPIQTLYEKLEEKDFEYGQVFDVEIPLMPERPEEPVAIADAGLEAILRQVTGVFDRPLNQGDLADIWKIAGETDSMWREVSDLTPMRYCLNIDGLFIVSSKVSDLTPLAGLTRLHMLSVTDSAVSDLAALSGLHQLLNLELRGNQITDVAPIQTLTNLERLDLSDNRIADFSPLFGLQNLGALFIGNNPATDTSGFEGIFQQLMEKDFEPGRPLPPALPMLMPQNPDKVIRFADKVLEKRIREAMGKPEGSITAGEAAKAEELYLGNEYQEKFPKGTQIANLSGLEYFINLKRLDISWNKINDIRLLANLTRLEYLRAYGNQIVSVAPLAKLEYLSSLNLGGNKLTKIDALKNLTSLTSLYLNDNSLTKIDALKDLVKLTELFLNGNKIKDFSPVEAYYTQLTEKDFTLE